MRDNEICQHCGSKKKLNAHHIKPYSKFPEYRYDVSNGLTLCSLCHLNEHTDKYKEEIGCACGCGKIIRKWKPYRKTPVLYSRGHNSRRRGKRVQN